MAIEGTLRRFIAVAVACSILLAVTGCARVTHRKTVRIEDQFEPEKTIGEESNTVHPPLCADVAMPTYPEEVDDIASPRVSVRVDLSVDEHGRALPLRAEVKPSGADDMAFSDAATEAVSQWECRPAWRLPRDGEPAGPFALPYRTWIVFVFERESMDKGRVSWGRDDVGS